MATTLPGKGTLLQITISAAATTIGQRVEIDGPDGEVKMRDTTHLDSPYMAYRPAIVDLGKLSGTLFYDPNDPIHEYVRARLYTPPTTPDTFTIVYADTDGTHAKDAMSGYLTKFSPTGMKVDDTLQAKFEIQLTDSITLTPGTP